MINNKVVFDPWEFEFVCCISILGDFISKKVLLGLLIFPNNIKIWISDKLIKMKFVENYCFLQRCTIICLTCELIPLNFRVL